MIPRIVFVIFIYFCFVNIGFTNNSLSMWEKGRTSMAIYNKKVFPQPVIDVAMDFLVKNKDFLKRDKKLEEERVLELAWENKIKEISKIYRWFTVSFENSVLCGKLNILYETKSNKAFIVNEKSDIEKINMLLVLKARSLNFNLSILDIIKDDNMEYFADMFVNLYFTQDARTSVKDPLHVKEEYDFLLSELNPKLSYVAFTKKEKLNELKKLHFQPYMTIYINRVCKIEFVAYLSDGSIHQITLCGTFDENFILTITSVDDKIIAPKGSIIFVKIL